MYPVGAGLYSLIVFLIPAFVGWLIGTVATLALLLMRPRLPGVSWLVVGVAELVWWRVVWAMQNGSIPLDHPVLSICTSFVIPLAVPTLAALGMRRVDRKQRRHLYSSSVPDTYPIDPSPVRSTTGAAEQGVGRTIGSSEEPSWEDPSYSRVALAIVVASLGVLFAVAMLSEWFLIIVTPSAAHIASYHFGSESMWSHGGWKYANPEVYAWTVFAEAMAAVAAIPALWMIIVRRSRRAVFALVLICAAYVGASLVLGQMQWEMRGTLSQGAAAEHAVEADNPAAGASEWNQEAGLAAGLNVNAKPFDRQT